MQTDKTEQMLRKQIKHVLHRIDALVEPSDFNQDWEIASQSVKKLSTRYIKDENRFNIWLRGIMRPKPVLASLVIGLLIGSLVVLTVQHKNQEESFETNATRQGYSTTLNPNKPWYGPTDDLLQISVLRYEYQWVTFVNYDPITMEIK